MMKRKERNYLLEYIDILLTKEPKEKGSRLLLMQHHNALYLTMEDLQAMGLEERGYQVYLHNYEPDVIRSPYEPFLDLIWNYVGQKGEDSEFSVEDFLTRSNAYFLHKPLFRSYFSGNECVRQENILVGEYAFEKRKFQETILNMLVEMGKEKPLLIFLNEANLAGDSLWRILDALLQKDTIEGIKIVAVVNETGDEPAHVEKEKRKFLKNCQEEEYICDWIYECDMEYPVKLNKSKNKYEDTKTLIKNLRNMSFSLEFEQAYYYLNEFFERIENEKRNIPPEEETGLLHIYFWSSLGLEDYSKALYICEMLEQLEFADENMQTNVNFSIAYYKTLVHMYSGNEPQTKENLIECKRLAEKIGTKKSIFLSKLIENMSQYAGWKDLWICENDSEVSDEFIEQCKEFGHFNHLAHIYVYSFNGDYHKFIATEGIEDRIVEFNKGIAIGKAIGNEQFLIEAYSKNIMLASIHGNYNVSIYFYQKTLELVREYGDEIGEAGHSNGMGYSNCGMENYTEAQKYYNNALRIYFRHELVDEVVETLYNMGINGILAEDYWNASEYLLSAANILHELKLNSMRACNTAKLYGLVALSSFRQGLMPRSHLYLNMTKQFLAHILGKDDEEKEVYSDDSMFLAYFVDALMWEKDGNDEEALFCLDKAEFYMNRSTGSMFFNYPQFAEAKYKVLQKLGEKEKAQGVLMACKSYCQEKKFLFHEQKLDILLGNPPEERERITYPKMKLEDISLSEVMEWIRKMAAEKNNKDMLRTIQFLNVLQRFINQMDDGEKELANIVPMFKNNFRLDHAIVIRCNEAENRIVYCDLNFQVSQDEVNQIVQYFHENTVGFVLSKNGYEYEEYKQVVDVFQHDRVFSLVAVPNFEKDVLTGVMVTYIKMKDGWGVSGERALLGEDDLAMLQYVFKQVFNAIEKQEVHRKLEDANEQLKAQMEQLVQLKDEAEAANEAKSNFLANMSHEIRTPMNAILGMAEIVLRTQLTKSQKNSIEQLQSAARSLLSIINDILDFSKIESGKMEITEDNYQMKDVITDIRNILGTRIGSKKLRLKLLVNQDIPQWLYGDDVRLRQILINLGNNAIKFTEQGNVTITVDYEPAEDSDYILLRISVKDTGIGIREEDQQKLFGAFTQVDGKRNRRIEGTGLGLSICKALVDLMGGTIYCRSEYGKGSKFTFVIPQKIVDMEDEDEMLEASAEKKMENFSAAGAKILIVDDNLMNLNVAEGLLEPFGMQIDTAQSGARVIEMLEQSPDYNMVFMDHMMPEMDGVETTQRIRNLEGDYYRNVPIIALSANAISGVREMFLENGMNDFLSKPIDMNQMEIVLKKWLFKVKKTGENTCLEKDLEKEIVNQSGNESDMNESKEALVIPGIDVEAAIQCSGTEALFRKLLQVFYDTLPKKVELISQLENDEDIKNYTIEVHALKSAARLIGAMELSSMAEYLEYCGKENDLEEIHKKTAELLELYNSYHEKLQPFVKIEMNEEKPILSKEKLLPILTELRHCLENFDIDGADNVMEELDKYSHEKEFAKIFPDLKSSVEDVAYDISTELLNDFLET